LWRSHGTICGSWDEDVRQGALASAVFICSVEDAREMMNRWVVILGLSGALAACSEGRTDGIVAVRHEVFAGEWRSVTPTLEFLRLTVQSKSSVRDEFAARLTFSGVVWEGSGAIAGDSLVLDMTPVGEPTAARTLVAHVSEGGGLRTRLESGTAPPLVVDFVRER
jgi:hypothetical protein